MVVTILRTRWLSKPHGRPVAELQGECAALEDVFGRGGRELADRLREERDWDVRFDVLERFLIGRVAAGRAPTPAVVWADRRLRKAGRNVRIGVLAAELGCSRRYPTNPPSLRAMSTQNIFPALRYRDADVALAWLPKAFGTEERDMYRGGGHIRDAELKLGDGLIMFGPYDEDGFLGGSPGGRGRARAVRHRLRLARVHRTRPGGQPVVVRDLQPA